MNSLRGKKVCYLNVELLELDDKCFGLEGSRSSDELLEAKVGVLPDC